MYLARPQEPGPGIPEKLVVKRLLPHFSNDAEGRTMFEREAQLHAAVTHENVVTVFHAGKDTTGEPYLAMEYIDGVDGYRLLRRLRQEGELLPIGVAVFVAREVLRALESVHAATDPSGGSLGIVHRDVSPSNIYLSKTGSVKLGDFGIARSTTRPTLRSDQGNVLKGKFAFLSPEHVAGEPSDQRADLFSLATVLAEMLLNRALFPGGGQLAILLAIRDCKIDALGEIRPRLPPGLYEVLERALARTPTARFPTARAFAEALAPFEADPRLAAREIAARVRWVKSATSSDRTTAQRRKHEPPPPAEPEQVVTIDVEEPEPEAKTSEYEALPSRVLKVDGTELGPWSFARLMEALATGQIVRGDRVDFVSRGYLPVEEIEELARFFPASDGTTSNVNGPGKPDFKDTIGPRTMLETLVRVLAKRETGVLFVERAEDDGSGKKELYFVAGRLHHVASSNASELLGQYLVRRNKLARDELDLALAVLPRYGGRMGDTLISMGLVSAVDIFRAIREQGRDRVADLFLWRGGELSFYRGHIAPHVEFPLDLELPLLVLAGLEAAKPGDAILDDHRDDLDRILGPVATGSVFEDVTWPPVVLRVLELTRRPVTLRDVLTTAARSGGVVSTGDVLRGIEILVAAGLLAWRG